MKNSDTEKRPFWPPKGQISFLMLKQEESLHTKRMVLEDITEPFSFFLQVSRIRTHGFDPELALLSKY